MWTIRILDAIGRVVIGVNACGHGLTARRSPLVRPRFVIEERVFWSLPSYLSSRD